MAQTSDTDTTIEDDNVRPFPGAGTAGPSRNKARPKDRTGAARQARYRNKNKGDRYEKRVKGSSPPTDPPPHVNGPSIKPSVTRAEVGGVTLPPPAPDRGVQGHGRGIRLAALIAALALATVSGGFSITGMTAIFVGAYWPVIGMGVALEVGKLAAVAWLGHHHSTGSWGLKVALGALVAVLMGLNAVGCYGFLAKAHIGHQVEGDVAAAGRAADVDGRIAVQASVVADLDRRIAQIDKAVEAAASKGKANAAMQLAADQRRNRADLASQRDQANKALAGLKVEKAGIEGQQKVADADLGPVRYLATLLGAGDQDVLRWFILVVAVLLDPAAVLLLLAATRR